MVPLTLGNSHIPTARAAAGMRLSGQYCVPWSGVWDFTPLGLLSSKDLGL